MQVELSTPVLRTQNVPRQCLHGLGELPSQVSPVENRWVGRLTRELGSPGPLLFFWVSVTCFSSFEIKSHQRTTIRPYTFKSSFPVCTLHSLQVIPIEERGGWYCQPISLELVLCVKCSKCFTLHLPTVSSQWYRLQGRSDVIPIFEVWKKKQSG